MSSTSAAADGRMYNPNLNKLWRTALCDARDSTTYQYASEVETDPGATGAQGTSGAIMMAEPLQLRGVMADVTANRVNDEEVTIMPFSHGNQRSHPDATKLTR